MQRPVGNSRLPSGEMSEPTDVTWQAVAGEGATQHTISIPMLATPRNWQ
jgi:hypothetical protein